MFQANYLDPSHSKTLHNKQSHCLSTLKPTSKLKLQLSKKKKKAILTINNKKNDHWSWTYWKFCPQWELEFCRPVVNWQSWFFSNLTHHFYCGGHFQEDMPSNERQNPVMYWWFGSIFHYSDCDDLLAHVSVCVLFLRGRMCSHDLAAVVCFLISVWHNRADAQVSDRPHATPPRTQMDRLFIYLLPLTPSVEHQG